MSSDDKMQLIVKGTAYREWYQVDVDSDIFTSADAFAVTAKVPALEHRAAFREGESLEVYIGDDRQMAGVIDRRSISGARGRTSMSVTGRDKGGWLIDNEAKHVKAGNYDLKTLAEKLLKPSFGIRSVILSNETNRKLLLGKKDRRSAKGTSRLGAPRFGSAPRVSTKIDPGQKIAQILDEHCKRLGVMWWITAGGDLFLGKPNYSQTPAFAFLCYERGSANAKRYNNILEPWSVDRDMADRCSELELYGQGLGSSGLFPAAGGAKGSKFRAKATDPDLVARGITRHLILTDSDVLNREQAQRSADAEMGKRRLQGLVINITVAGFRQEGRLYTVDTLAKVVIEEDDVDGEFYITQRRFVENRGRRRTQLTLHEKGVYLP